MPVKTMQQVLLEIGQKQATMFQDNNIAYVDCLVKYKSMRSLMNSVYNMLVFTKRADKIENLLIEEKTTLFETAKEFAKGTLPLKELVQLCKALYTLEYLIT